MKHLQCTILPPLWFVLAANHYPPSHCIFNHDVWNRYFGFHIRLEESACSISSSAMLMMEKSIVLADWLNKKNSHLKKSLYTRFLLIFCTLKHSIIVSASWNSFVSLSTHLCEGMQLIFVPDWSLFFQYSPVLADHVSKEHSSITQHVLSSSQSPMFVRAVYVCWINFFMASVKC